MTNKYAHRRRDTVPAKDCAWPGCKTLIPKSHDMCEPHWLQLPKELRDDLWFLYEADQENSPEGVSEEYQLALDNARTWAATHDRVMKR